MSPADRGIRTEGAGLVSLQTSHTDPFAGFAFSEADGIHIPAPVERAPVDLDAYGPVVSLGRDSESAFKRRHNRLRRNVWFAGSCLTRTAAHGARIWLATLTYRTGDDVAPKQVAKALNCLRTHYARLRIRVRYLWVVENQARGVPHYHIVLWLPKGAGAPPKFDEAGWWPYGMSNRKPVTKSATGYVMKYVSKWDHNHCQFPKALRLYGAGGLDLSDRRIRQWTNLPGWSRAEYGVGELKREKGGLMELATGEILEPRYAAVITRTTIRLVQVRDIVPKWYEGPYSRYETGETQ